MVIENVKIVNIYGTSPAGFFFTSLGLGPGPLRLGKIVRFWYNLGKFEKDIKYT